MRERGGAGDGREGRRRHPHAGGSARHDRRRRHPHRRQRQRQDCRGHRRLSRSRAQPCHAAPSRKAAVRFRERSELLDFLLEVSAATSQTLDLDQLLANVAEIVQTRAALRPVRHPAVQRAAPRPAHPLRRGPSRGGGAQPVASRWAKASPEPPPRAASRCWWATCATIRAICNAVDAVRTELAVPMIARGKLVGVIDLQSTRLNAYTRIRPRAAAADRRARGHRHRQRAALSAASSGRTAR